MLQKQTAWIRTSFIFDLCYLTIFKVFEQVYYLHLDQYIKIRDEKGVEHHTTITNITWKFRGGQQIKCVGEDSRTLSQARKRTQAVRMGERIKTQINRLENKVTGEDKRIESLENGDRE